MDGAKADTREVGIVKFEIELANRWEFAKMSGCRGVLVHDWFDIKSPRIGISYYEEAGPLGADINTTWRDRKTKDPVQDVKDWVASAGAVIVGNITIPVVGTNSEHVINSNPAGFFYLLVTNESHSKMVTYFKEKENPWSDSSRRASDYIKGSQAQEGKNSI